MALPPLFVCLEFMLYGAWVLKVSPNGLRLPASWSFKKNNNGVAQFSRLSLCGFSPLAIKVFKKSNYAIYKVTDYFNMTIIVA